MNRLITVDGFYEDPVSVRKLALNRVKYQAPEDLPNGYAGTESIKGFYSRELVNRISKIIGEEVIADDRQFAFGVFTKKILSDQSRRAIHVDRSGWTAIIYLSPNPAPHSGTGIYRHIATGDETFNPNRESLYQADGMNPLAWQMTAEVGNLFNRLVVFNSGQMFHAGLNYFGDNDQNCRLSQVFFFNTRGAK